MDNVSEMEFRKIWAMLPADLYNELKEHNLLNQHFDAWLCKVIRAELKRKDLEAFI